MSVNKCEECFYFNRWKRNEDSECVLICTKNIIWDPTGDIVTMGYKKVDAEDVACECFKEDF